jgi:hypothetical protein
MITADDTEITLSADSQAVLKSKAREVHEAIAILTHFLDQDQSLTVGMSSSALRVAEYKISDIATILGVPTEGSAEIEERHRKLREANIEIRSLKDQLGKSQSPELTQLSLRTLERQLQDWWEKEGFGHIPEIHFKGSGCRAKLSCHMFGDFPILDSPTPISDKERKALWHDELRARGFVLIKEDRDPDILDCDASRKALSELILSRLPSAKIIRVENHCTGNNGFKIRDVEVIIYNLDDIARLPAVVETKETALPYTTAASDEAK